MKNNIALYIGCLILLIVTSCKKDDSKIEYQDGYPTILAGNWVVFEAPVSEFGNTLYDPYDLVTSLDPNNNGQMIFDKLYDSDVRIRASFDSNSFKTEMAPQLETISNNTYDIAFVSLEGYVSQNPVIINQVYLFARSSFENLAFAISDIKDVIFIRAGYYDKYKDPVDTVIIMGYRKIGFEDVKY